MRLWAAAPRDELLAIARRLFGDGELARQDGAESRAYVHVVGCLSLCDDYAAAETAIELMFADARRRGSASMFAAASQLRARQRLWTGPIAEAVLDARAAFDMRRGASQMYQHAAAYCLVSGLLEQDDPEAAEDVLRAGCGPRRPWASSPPGSSISSRAARGLPRRERAGAGSVPRPPGAG